MPQWNETLYELGLFIACVAAIVIYELAQRGRHGESDSPNLRGWQARVRTQWVETLMKPGRQEILAVQTLRNSVMAASFMASISGLALPGVFTMSTDLNRQALEWHRAFGLPFAGGLQPLKMMVLVTVFFSAFVLFVQAIRLFNHVGYMIVLPLESPQSVPSHEVARYLNLAGGSFSHGVRVFFSCLPVAAWLIDVHLLVVATVILLLIYRQFDRRP
jgi:uncharacterized membrane protein